MKPESMGFSDLSQLWGSISPYISGVEDDFLSTQLGWDWKPDHFYLLFSFLSHYSTC